MNWNKKEFLRMMITHSHGHIVKIIRQIYNKLKINIVIYRSYLIFVHIFEFDIV